MTPYAWLAALLVVIATFAGTYWKGRVDGKEVVRAEWQAADNARKVAEDKAIADRLRANELRVKQEAADKAKIVKGYENEIAKLRADRNPDVRLRLPASVCDGLAGSTKGEGSGARDADSSATRLLPAAHNRNLLALADQADEVIATCRALQDWVKSQGLAP